jgi:anti-anti-sigma factor
MGSLALNEVRKSDGDFVLTVSGIVDDATVEYFEQGLARAGGAGSGQVIVDLTACWLDSAGLAALVRLQRRSNGRSAQTCLLVRDVELLKMLQLVGLTSHFPTFLTSDAAAGASAPSRLGHRGGQDSSRDTQSRVVSARSAPARSSRVRASTARHSLSEAH